ncbi:hypothetical protein PLICRDRAFT_44016 [Plicaturopsis crispa FD-325 SS-3]|nr:hypothetical protein PLICRDRAFT_44016 [Plicaturopsis crispa FD-325 SS-3]
MADILNPSQTRWVQSDATSSTSASASADASDASIDANNPPNSLVNLPVYLNNDRPRSDVLFIVELPFDSSAGALVAMRAVCLTAGG